MPCNKIDIPPIVVHKGTLHYVMTSIITSRERWQNFDVFPKMRFLSNVMTCDK